MSAGPAQTAAAPAAAARAQALQAQVGRWGPGAIVGVVAGLFFGWIAFRGTQNPRVFLTVGLNAITLAGLYFVVASGFTLIFGLMRVVNMAHGSFFLLGGYISLRLSRELGWPWPAVLAVSCLGVALLGLVAQQAFLRWNQGQLLRQALITIAISIILADQMLREFGGIALDPGRPAILNFQVGLKFFGLSYPFGRFFVVFMAVGVGIGLYLWLRKTRSGMIIRAGVDDRQMVSALGINIQLVFALAFMVGSGLAAFAGYLYGFTGSYLPGVDTQFLLSSLIVVIIGGMGSLLGAAIGALLLAIVDSYGDIYLVFGDYNLTNYSILLTFGLLVFVLAVRPLGLFGRPA
jgi:branched-chain amino acid transport system permease protein